MTNVTAVAAWRRRFLAPQIRWPSWAIDAPVLILAGENDARCPIRQIENYIARLEELGKPHEVYRFDAGHSSFVVEETIRQMEAQLAFAARHLGTPQPL